MLDERALPLLLSFLPCCYCSSYVLRLRRGICISMCMFIIMFLLLLRRVLTLHARHDRPRTTHCALQARARRLCPSFGPFFKQSEDVALGAMRAARKVQWSLKPRHRTHARVFPHSHPPFTNHKFRAEVGRTWPNSVQHRATSRAQPTSAESASELADFGQTSPKLPN